MQISLWNEKKSLDSIFGELKEFGFETNAIREVAKCLVIKKYIEQYNIQAKSSPDEIFEAFCKNFGILTEEQKNEFLSRGKESKESFSKKLLLQEKTNSLRMLIGSPEAINQAFVQNKEQFDIAAFELIVLSDENFANELYTRISENGEDFMKLANEFSHSQDKTFGPLPVANLSPEMKKVVLEISENEVSKPFEIQNKQFALIKLRKLQKAQLNQQIALGIQNKIFDEWLNRQIDSASLELVD